MEMLLQKIFLLGNKIIFGSFKFLENLSLNICRCEATAINISFYIVIYVIESVILVQ